MTDIDIHMMPVKPAYSRLWPMLNAKAVEKALAQDLKLSVHVSMDVLEADWRALERSGTTSLHQSFDWCAAWIRTHRHQVLFVRGRLQDRTVFILPLELVRGFLFRKARFIGSPHSNMNTGIFAEDIDPATGDELAATLIADLARILSSVADVVTLEKMPLDWHGVRHPLASLPSVQNQNSSYQLPLLATFDATLSQINAKRRRKKFRLSQRRLEALGGYDHIVATTPDECRNLLGLFFEQKATRFKALGLPNVFKDAETQAFFQTLAATAPDDWSQPLQLNAIRLRGENDGRILAIAGLSRKGDHVICQFGSIDETIAADSSPGELLFYLMIEKCVAAGIRIFDFGIGDQGYKRSWCTVETVQRDIILPLTVRGRIAAGLHRAMVRTKTSIKKNRKVYAFVQRFRQRRQGDGVQTTPETDAD